MTKRDRSPPVDIGSRSKLSKSSSSSSSLSPSSSRDARTIFVNQLAQVINEDDLYEYFSLIGTIEKVNVVRDHRSGNSKGFAYIEFHEEENATIATLLDQIKPDFQKIPIHVKSQKDNKLDLNQLNQQQSLPIPTFIPLAQVPNQNKLYVGSINATVKDDIIKQLITSLVGKLERFTINRDFGGHSRGFGFAVFESPEMVEKAIEKLNGYILCGRPLKASYVQDNYKVQTLQPVGPSSSSNNNNNNNNKANTMNMNTNVMNSHLPYQANQDVNMSNWNLEADSSKGAKMTADTRLSLMRKLGERAGVDVPSSNIPVAPVDPSGRPVPLLGEVSNAFVVFNMFDPTTEIIDEWYLDVQEEVAEECNKFGEVELCRVDKVSPLGLVYLVFAKREDAQKAATSLHGRYFAQRFVTVKYMDEAAVREKSKETLS